MVCGLKIENEVTRKVMDYHLWFGRNSFYIMATHVPVKGIIMVAIAKAIGKKVGFVGNDWICMPVVFVLTCAVCSVLAVYIGKMKKKDEQRMARLQLSI